MAQTKTLANQLKLYLQKVSRVIPVEHAYLVGSRASDRTGRDSDVDLLVVSKGFAVMDADQRLDLLYRQSAGIGLELHLLAVTPEELESASSLTTLGAIRRDQKILLQ
jgi:predicted nucleotidyltransferase